MKAFTPFDEKITSWLRQKEAPAWAAHRTQINSIRELMRGLIEDLRGDAKALENLPVADLYEQARNLEVSVLWLTRLWNFLRTPFDQRDDTGLKGLLQAADEVAWSCYSIPFSVTDRPRGPAPLPFIESRFSPAAFPREAVPSELDEELGRFQALNALPMGLLRLPPSAIRSPWWLVLIGHEAGHHVQFDLLPGRKLEALFGAGMRKAVEKMPAIDQRDPFLWENWSPEIFADMFSLCSMGSGALRAMIELELRPAARMVLLESPHYPPPSVRLRLMACAHDELLHTRDGENAVEPFAPVTTPIERFVKVIPEIVEYCLAPLPEIGKNLAEITAFDGKAMRTTVRDWQDRYWSASYGAVDTDPEMPRLLAAAAMAAYASADAGADFAALANRVTKVIVESRSQGERGAEKVSAASSDVLGDLRKSIRIASGLLTDVG